MDFSKPRNLILLIISLLVILSLSINASWAWFNFSKNKPIDTKVSVLKFDFRTDNVFNKDITVTLDVDSPNNYVNGYIAPGVRGYHTFALSNAGSDVPVKYTVTFNRSASTFPSNMVFYKDDSYNDASLVNDGYVWKDVSIAKRAADSKTFSFEWKFLTSDEANRADTEFKNQNGKIELVFTITAEQI